MADVCEVIRVTGDAVQPEGSSMRDIAEPMNGCCVYCDRDAQMTSDLRRRILRCCVVARWLPLQLVDVSC